VDQGNAVESRHHCQAVIWENTCHVYYNQFQSKKGCAKPRGGSNCGVLLELRKDWGTCSVVAQPLLLLLFAWSTDLRQIFQLIRPLHLHQVCSRYGLKLSNADKKEIWAFRFGQGLSKVWFLTCGTVLKIARYINCGTERLSLQLVVQMAAIIHVVCRSQNVNFHATSAVRKGRVCFILRGTWIIIWASELGTFCWIRGNLK